MYKKICRAVLATFLVPNGIIGMFGSHFGPPAQNGFYIGSGKSTDSSKTGWFGQESQKDDPSSSWQRSFVRNPPPAGVLQVTRTAQADVAKALEEVKVTLGGSSHKDSSSQKKVEKLAAPAKELRQQDKSRSDGLQERTMALMQLRDSSPKKEKKHEKSLETSLQRRLDELTKPYKDTLSKQVQDFFETTPVTSHGIGHDVASGATAQSAGVTEMHDGNPYANPVATLASGMPVMPGMHKEHYKAAASAHSKGDKPPVTQKQGWFGHTILSTMRSPDIVMQDDRSVYSVPSVASIVTAAPPAAQAAPSGILQPGPQQESNPGQVAAPPPASPPSGNPAPSGSAPESLYDSYEFQEIPAFENLHPAPQETTLGKVLDFCGHAIKDAYRSSSDFVPPQPGYASFVSVPCSAADSPSPAHVPPMFAGFDHQERAKQEKRFTMPGKSFFDEALHGLHDYRQRRSQEQREWRQWQGHASHGFREFTESYAQDFVQHMATPERPQEYYQSHGHDERDSRFTPSSAPQQAQGDIPSPAARGSSSSSQSQQQQKQAPQGSPGATGSYEHYLAQQSAAFEWAQRYHGEHSRRQSQGSSSTASSAPQHPQPVKQPSAEKPYPGASSSSSSSQSRQQQTQEPQWLSDSSGSDDEFLWRRCATRDKSREQEQQVFDSQKVKADSSRCAAAALHAQHAAQAQPQDDSGKAPAATGVQEPKDSEQAPATVPTAVPAAQAKQPEETAAAAVADKTPATRQLKRRSRKKGNRKQVKKVSKTGEEATAAVPVATADKAQDSQAPEAPSAQEEQQDADKKVGKIDEEATGQAVPPAQEEQQDADKKADKIDEETAAAAPSQDTSKPPVAKEHTEAPSAAETPKAHGATDKDKDKTGERKVRAFLRRAAAKPLALDRDVTERLMFGEHPLNRKYDEFAQGRSFVEALDEAGTVPQGFGVPSVTKIHDDVVRTKLFNEEFIKDLKQHATEHYDPEIENLAKDAEDTNKVATHVLETIVAQNPDIQFKTEEMVKDDLQQEAWQREERARSESRSVGAQVKRSLWSYLTLGFGVSWGGAEPPKINAQAGPFTASIPLSTKTQQQELEELTAACRRAAAVNSLRAQQQEVASPSSFPAPAASASSAASAAIPTSQMPTISVVPIDHGSERASVPVRPVKPAAKASQVPTAPAAPHVTKIPQPTPAQREAPTAPAAQHVAKTPQPAPATPKAPAASALEVPKPPQAPTEPGIRYKPLQMPGFAWLVEIEHQAADDATTLPKATKDAMRDGTTPLAKACAQTQQRHQTAQAAAPTPTAPAAPQTTKEPWPFQAQPSVPAAASAATAAPPAAKTPQPTPAQPMVPAAPAVSAQKLTALALAASRIERPSRPSMQDMERLIREGDQVGPTLQGFSDRFKARIAQTARAAGGAGAELVKLLVTAQGLEDAGDHLMADAITGETGGRQELEKATKEAQRVVHEFDEKVGRVTEKIAQTAEAAGTVGMQLLRLHIAAQRLEDARERLMVDAITGGTEGAQAMQQAMQEAQHVTAELREKVEHIAGGIAAMQSMPPEQKGAMLADLTFDYYTGAAAAKAGGMAAKLAKRAVGLGAAAKEASVAGTLAREAEAAAAKAAHAARETEAATAGCVGPQKPKMPGKGTFAAEAPAAAEATVAAEVPKAAITDVTKVPDFLEGYVPPCKGSDLEMTNTVKKHIMEMNKEGEWARPYMRGGTSLLVDEIMAAARPFKDAGSKSGLKWVVPGHFNGSTGIWELVINPDNNMILHLLFKSVN